MSGYKTPKAAAFTLPRGEYQIAPSLVTWIFGVSAVFCGLGYSVKVWSFGLNFHSAAALPHIRHMPARRQALCKTPCAGIPVKPPILFPDSAATALARQLRFVEV